MYPILYGVQNYGCSMVGGLGVRDGGCIRSRISYRKLSACRLLMSSILIEINRARSSYNRERSCKEFEGICKVLSMDSSSNGYFKEEG